MSPPLPEQLQSMIERATPQVREAIENLPVQDVLERLPQRFRPEPKRRSKAPFVLGAIGLVVFVFGIVMALRARKPEQQHDEQREEEQLVEESVAREPASVTTLP